MAKDRKGRGKKEERKWIRREKKVEKERKERG